jgi:hypothetical protein
MLVDPCTVRAPILLQIGVFHKAGRALIKKGLFFTLLVLVLK